MHVCFTFTQKILTTLAEEIRTIVSFKKVVALQIDYRQFLVRKRHKTQGITDL
jgi:hypothetical protein